MADVGPVRPGSGALTAGWICFLISCVIAILPIPTLFLWVVFAFVAFVLAIVGLAQGRVGSGILLLIGSVTAPWILSVVGMVFFFKGVASSSAMSPVVRDWTPSPQQQQAPSKPTASPSHVANDQNVEAPTTTAASTSSDPIVPAVVPNLAMQQIESWPTIDGIALGRSVAAKIGGNAAGTIVVPLIEPRIHLSRSQAGRFTWADPSLSTFLCEVNRPVGQALVSVGANEAATRKATGDEKVLLIESTATTAVWTYEVAERTYANSPTTPLLRVTKLSDASEVATIPFPRLPADVNAGNASGYKVRHVAIASDGHLYVLWSVQIKDLSGTRRGWYVDWYSAETGAASKQMPLFADDHVNSRDLLDAGVAGYGLWYGMKTGHQSVDLSTGAVFQLPKLPSKPRFLGDGSEVSCTKPGKTDEVKVVVADETGKIMQSRSDRLENIVTYRKVGEAYDEGTAVISSTPVPMETAVWVQAPYMVQGCGKYWLVVNIATGQVLGALEGAKFLRAQVTDATIRVAMSASNPTEARVYELVKQ